MSSGSGSSSIKKGPAPWRQIGGASVREYVFYVYFQISKKYDFLNTEVEH